MEKNTRFERGALITLSVMLVGVFLLSVHMYDTISQGTADGALAAFAESAREFVYENDAVAAFLGIDTAAETFSESDGIDVSAEAAAYIERYNKIYENAE